jgi:hypothetical protein
MAAEVFPVAPCRVLLTPWLGCFALMLWVEDLSPLAPLRLSFRLTNPTAGLIPAYIYASEILWGSWIHLRLGI